MEIKQHPDNPNRVIVTVEHYGEMTDIIFSSGLFTARRMRRALEFAGLLNEAPYPRDITLSYRALGSVAGAGLAPEGLLPPPSQETTEAITDFITEQLLKQ